MHTNLSRIFRFADLLWLERLMISSTSHLQVCVIWSSVYKEPFSHPYTQLFCFIFTSAQRSWLHVFLLYYMEQICLAAIRSCPLFILNFVWNNTTGGKTIADYLSMLSIFCHWVLFTFSSHFFFTQLSSDFNPVTR